MAHAPKEVSADDTCASWRGLNALVGVLTLAIGIGATLALFRRLVGFGSTLSTALRKWS